MKKTVVLLLSLFLLLALSVKTEAASPMIIVDGRILPLNMDLDPSPVNDNGVTMVPLSRILETLGQDAITDPYSGTITVQMGTSLLEMQVGSAKAYLNGHLLKMPAPIKKVNNCPMVPLRSVCEALQAEIKWLPRTNTVLVTSNQVAYLSQQITGSLATPAAKARAIHDWICQNISYDTYFKKPGETGCGDRGPLIRETSPAYIFLHRKAYSYGFANLNLALLCRSGIPVQNIDGTYQPNRPTFWNENAEEECWGWNRACIDGKWIIIDTALDATSKTDQYFDPRPNDFEKNHPEILCRYTVYPLSAENSR